MSGLPAAVLGLDRAKRGLLERDYAADIAVFDPDRVRDTASFERPNRLAEGFEEVVVNGVLVRSKGKATAARPGRVLRHGARE
jgi:N-acyl-D-aspartate/D-glutamate deacylase